MKLIEAVRNLFKVIPSSADANILVRMSGGASENAEALIQRYSKIDSAREEVEKAIVVAENVRTKLSQIEVNKLQEKLSAYKSALNWYSTQDIGGSAREALRRGDEIDAR